VRYGSRSNTKKRTVTINGSVRFALLTVSLKNGTVTVALAVKNGTVKKTENGTVPNSDALLYNETSAHTLLLAFLARYHPVPVPVGRRYLNLPHGPRKMDAVLKRPIVSLSLLNLS
jgi:hypothetical protein